MLKSKVLAAKPEEHLNMSLSVSKCKTFTSCKLKFKYTYIDKLPQKEWSFFLTGTFAHEILELFYKQIINGSTESPNIILSKAWKEAYLNFKAKLTSDQTKEVKGFMMVFLKMYCEELNKPKVIAVEDNFYIDVDGRVLLNGFIDRVQIDPDGVLHVADYKTTKDKKDLKKDFFQLLLYAFVMCLRDPSLQQVRGSYILLRHNFESIVKTFERDEIMQIESKILAYADSIDAEKLYRPQTSFLCNYCSFQDICPEGARMARPNFEKFGQEKW